MHWFLCLQCQHPPTADDYAKLALAHYEEGHYEEAIKDTKEAIRIFDRAGKHLDMGRCYALLGRVYTKQEQYQQAITCFTSSLDLRPVSLISSIYDYDLVASTTHFFLAVVYHKQEDYAQAIHHCEESLPFRKALPDDHKNIGAIYLLLAISYVMQEKYQEAIPYAKEAYRIFK